MQIPIRSPTIPSVLKFWYPLTFRIICRLQTLREPGLFESKFEEYLWEQYLGVHVMGVQWLHTRGDEGIPSSVEVD
jgi:hypothetical protein